MADTFDELIEAGASADVSGWGFSWLEGHATEERPPGATLAISLSG